MYQYPTFKGKRIFPTLSATRELMKLGMTLEEVVEVLELGYDCAPGRRKKGVIEKGLQVGKKEIRVVIGDNIFIHPDGHQEDIWSLVHVGKTTYKKRR